MTLKGTFSSNIGNHQADNSNEQDNNEKYRLLGIILEKKIEKMSTSNEKIAARYELFNFSLLDNIFTFWLYFFRSLAVKKLIKKRSKDVELLKTRLDSYRDNWRS